MTRHWFIMIDEYNLELLNGEGKEHGYHKETSC